jgi:hypothetical protein
VNIGFGDLDDHVVPMDGFRLNWRFTDENYRKLPDEHLSQLKPLDNIGANFLWDHISITGLHRDIPFKKNFFSTIDKAKICNGNEREIKKWLYRRGLPFSKLVYLSYQPDTAIIVPWKLLVKYFDNFYRSDDLTVIDESLNWALLFYHEDEIYFGTNEKYQPEDIHDDVSFLW